MSEVLRKLVVQYEVDTGQLDEAGQAITRTKQSTIGGIKSAEELEKAMRDLGVQSFKVKKATADVGATMRKLRRDQLAAERATKQATDTMAKMRGVAGQLGYQVQDVAVQLQSGTDGLIVFGQQGSQIAATFGPAGAVVGALIAVGAAAGGAMLTGLGDGEEALKTAREEADRLTESLEELGKAEAARALEKEAEAQAGFQAALDETNAKIKEYQAAVNAPVESLFDQGEAERVQQVVKEGRANLSQWEADLESLQRQIDRSTEKQRQLAEVVAGTFVSTAEQEAYSEMIGDTFSRWEEAAAKRNSQAEKDAKAESRRLDQAKKEWASFTSQIGGSWSAEENARTQAGLAVIDSLKTEAQARAEAHQRQLQALDLYYEMHKDQESEHDLWRRELNEQYAKDMNRLTVESAAEQGDIWAQLYLGLQESQQGMGDLFDDQLSRLSAGFGEVFETAVFDSENMGDAVDTMFDGMGRAVVAFFGEWMAQRLMMWALESTLTQASAMQSAQVLDAEAKSTSLIAAENAYSSAAKIPYVGWLLAPAAGAAALAATSSFGNQAVASFAGAFDKGGRIPYGSFGIVAEYADELADGVLVKGPANITGSDATRRIMQQDNSSHSGPVSISITSHNGNPQAIARAVERVMRNPSKRLQTDTARTASKGRRNMGMR